MRKGAGERERERVEERGAKEKIRKEEKKKGET